MPIIKSAKKRVKIAIKRQRRNEITKAKYKTLTKDFIKLMEEGKTKEAVALYPQVQKAIDMAVKKNVLHMRTAGRRKSALAKMMAKS